MKKLKFLRKSFDSYEEYCDLFKGAWMSGGENLRTCLVREWSYLVVIDDKLTFKQDDVVDTYDYTHKEPWKIIISDDEEEVHAVTRMVLSDFSYEGRQLEFLSAFSGPETKTLIKQHPDTALMLLDVVMDEDHSGLDVVRYVREELKNKFIRIILRTGQPGQAPERQVIAEYDINDYREKTELTAQKLYTTVTAALRAFRDLKTIELEQIVAASASIFELQSLNRFTSGVLLQLTSLLNIENKSDISAMAIGRNAAGYYVFDATGIYKGNIGCSLEDSVSDLMYRNIRRSIDEKSSLFDNSSYIGYFKARDGSENILFLETCSPLRSTDRDLIRVFSTNITVAFDNLTLNQEIEQTQREILFKLGAVVESRSHEIGNHVERVAAISHLLALKAGFSVAEAELLRLASPMHDLGKIGIPDKILNKPGRLSCAEFEIIKKHTTIGYNILKGSSRKLIKTAAIIAHEHHEYWDGLGYPQGLKGFDIHIYGRITLISDVFDALSIPRVYKEAWSKDRIFDYLTMQKGTQFDPELCKLFLDSFEEFYSIRQQYPD